VLTAFDDASRAAPGIELFGGLVGHRGSLRDVLIAKPLGFGSSVTLNLLLLTQPFGEGPNFRGVFLRSPTTI